MSKNQYPDDLPDKKEQLRKENEIKKEKLRQEYGADLSGSNKNLSPEIEGQFLDYILNFEKAFENAEPIQLFEMIGRPEYRKSEDIPDTEIGEELDNLFELLNQHNLTVDTICEVEDRELYRFITEELFLEEIDNMKVPGMFTHFTYEEFHPNHAYDIENHSIDFFRIYLDKKSTYYTTFLSKEAEAGNWHTDFRASFRAFTIRKFSITKLFFDLEKARVQFECDFTGEIENSIEKVRYSGKGKMELVNQWGFWCIDKLILPQH
ncbi:hypothetical protein [Parabacteroides sp. FAFU027]|uniref:hypothetical protein n=1 Tax=Parabacteroides sp. FAFU027 TaxID=2922715 RepID=UPI001FAF29DE|nr:hypothetical protein [Parabacteroides sp. FAFU027]